MEIQKRTVYFWKLDLLASLYAGQAALKKTIPSHQSSTSQLANYEQLELAISKLNKEIRVFERHFIMNIHPSNSVQHNII